MKGKYSKILGFILMLLLVPGVTLLSSTTAQAQRRTVIVVRPIPRFHRFGWYPYPYSYPYYGYYNNYVFGSSESAFNHGYRDGLKTGEGDVRHRRSYDPERSHYFHDAGFGNFAVEYRDGFRQGYDNGYRS